MFNTDHPLNQAQISTLTPISFIQELQGIRLALVTADTHNIYPLLILIDNKPALEIADQIIKNPDRTDLDELASHKEEVTNILKDIKDLAKDKNIKLQHIKAHKSIPSTMSRGV